MATKNNPGRYDCHAHAQPDEPLFTLLGRDPMAGSLVREWARMRESCGEDPAKVAEARACAEAMDKWAVAQGKVLVGAPVETRKAQVLHFRTGIRIVLDEVLAGSLVSAVAKLREMLAIEVV